MKRLIRPYQDADLSEMMDCWESANSVAHPFMTDEFLEQERYNIPNVYMPHAETWVIEHDKQVIGFLALLGNEIGGLFVKPEFHGTGAGWALLNKAVDLRGNLEVEVFKSNSIGRKFYDRCGFKFVSEKMHDETGQVLLRLKLAPREQP